MARVVVAVAALAAVLCGGARAETPIPVEIVVDTTAAGEPFPHYWKVRPALKAAQPHACSTIVKEQWRCAWSVALNTWHTDTRVHPHTHTQRERERERGNIPFGW